MTPHDFDQPTIDDGRSPRLRRRRRSRAGRPMIEQLGERPNFFTAGERNPA